MPVRTWHDDNPHAMRAAMVGAPPTLPGKAAPATPAAPSAPAAPLVSSRTLDRKAADGPTVLCCHRRWIAADMLVRIPDALVPKVQGRFPHLTGTGPFYLCDGCTSTLLREGIVTTADLQMP